MMDVVTSPFRALQDWVRDALQGDDSIRTGEGSSIVRMLMLPFRLLWGFAVFMVQAWTTSRSGFAFIRALPAMSVMTLAGACIWFFSTFVNASFSPTTQYHRMHRANSRENPEYALMFSKKMVDLKPESLQAKFLMAEDYATAGDTEEAVRIMKYLTEVKTTDYGTGEIRIATDEGENAAGKHADGFPDAHIWMSRYYQRKQIADGMSDELTQASMYHLSKAVEQDSENVLAKISLADLYLAQSRSVEEGSEEYRKSLESARDSLVDLTNRDFTRIEQVMAMPQLVDIYVKLGDDAGAKRTLNSAVNRVAMIARRNPEVFEIWLSLVQAAVAMKEYEQAQEFIREGYQTVQTRETRLKIVRLSSLVFLQNADDFKLMRNEQEFRLRLFALCNAIKANPRDIGIYQRLVEYIDIDAGQPEREAWLQNSIVGQSPEDKCPIPGVVHILIGTREIIRGNVVEGQEYWRIGQHEYKTAQLVVHRLIAVAAQSEEGFPHVDEMVSLAIEMFPDQPMLYETRGAIHKKEGRIEDALLDFNVVVERIPDSITVHQHMADCYVALGNEAKAEYHASRVKEILEELDAEQQKVYEQILNDL